MTNFNNVPLSKMDPPELFMTQFGKIVQVKLGDIIAIQRNEYEIIDLYQFTAEDLSTKNNKFGTVTINHIGAIYHPTGEVINHQKKK